MGKYTDIALKYQELEPQAKAVRSGVVDNIYVNINNNLNEIETPSQDSKPGRDTNLRTTNLTKLETSPPVDTPLRPYAVNAVVGCIHETTADKCAVCSGYVRWLGSDEARLLRAQRDPEAVRREFWREVKGGAS